MASQCFKWLRDIGVPLPHIVKGMGLQFGISKVLRKFNGALEPLSRTFVIASGPEGAEVNQALPFIYSIVPLVSCFLYPFVIMQCCFKFAEGFIRLPACAIHHWRWWKSQVPG